MVFRGLIKKGPLARLPGMVSILCAVVMLHAATFTECVHAETVSTRYPGLVSGALGSATLETLEKGTLLISEGVTITEADLLSIVNGQAPELRGQLEKNLLFLLERETTRRVLLAEAERAGIEDGVGDENTKIGELFDRKTARVSVSDEELQEFYHENSQLLGGASFEQVRDGIRHYLLNEKKQQEITVYVNGLGAAAQVRVNETWLDKQSHSALDNSLDRARRSGRPTMVEFGAAGCVPCDMMQPILENVRKNHPKTVNVVFIDVRDEQILAARYGIRSIPVQVFLDAEGRETFRHVGFLPEDEVTAQLARMGVAK